jgi:putative Mg2+ transporter-C (MgtC) family protein
MPDASLFETAEQLIAVLPPFLVRCGVAVVCGGLIGIERELRRKPAGFRTNILICLGSSIYMAIGLLVRSDTVDATRIAAQVVTGIGFIGAGCIIQERSNVRGLTTAATIWVVASIGILSGAGYPVLAIVSSFLVLLALETLRRVEMRWLNRIDLDDYRDPDDNASR